MGNFPQVRGRNLLKALEKAGFVNVRTRGSHHFLRHPDGRTTVVSVHAGENVGHGLLAKILADCDMDREDLLKLL